MSAATRAARAASDPAKGPGDARKVDPLMAAVQFVIEGTPDLPVAKIGDLYLPENSAEANRCSQISDIVKDYAGRRISDAKGRPLSIAVFGPPGSGKSFCAEQITAQAGCAEPVAVNLSQLANPRELAESLKKRAVLTRVKDMARGKKRRGTRVFFFDEFDATLDGVSLGWLRWFLAPMQDGKFLLGGQPIKVGKAIFMFAGGTASSLAEFEKRAQEDEKNYRDKKVPDFISRLRGFIDIEGVNGTDAERPVRRALVLQRFLDKRWPGERSKNGNVFPIDEQTVSSLLSNVHFVHGVRSMEALLDMSHMEAGPPAKVCLPDNELRKLHLSRGLLDGKVIGISAGLQDSSAQDLLQELADKLLRNGATLAYGGEFMPKGTLDSVVASRKKIPDDLVKRRDKRIRNYLGFLSLRRPAVKSQIEKEAEYVDFVQLETLSPAELEELSVPPDIWFAARSDTEEKPYNSKHHLAWAINLFRMRVRLIQDIHALIVLGGKDDGESWGRFSGIAEEVMLAVALKKPVYVFGGCGGGARAVGRLLGLDQTVANPEGCLVEEKIGGPLSSEAEATYFALPGHPELPQTTRQVRSFLFERSVTTPGWTWNGLDLEENRKLFGDPIGTSGDARKECVDLIIAGLLRLDWKLPPSKR